MLQLVRANNIVTFLFIHLSSLMFSAYTNAKCAAKVTKSKCTKVNYLINVFRFKAILKTFLIRMSNPISARIRCMHLQTRKLSNDTVPSQINVYKTEEE